MKILTVDTGISSIIFNLFDMHNEDLLASGIIDGIETENSQYTIKYNQEVITEEIEINNHVEAINILFEKLKTLNIINNSSEINAIGHRIVHGAEIFTDSVIINDKVISQIEELSEYAPLQIPYAIKGINAFKEVLPEVLMVASFDTAFYQTITKENALYPVPYNWYKDYGIRKYGFQGNSHKYIMDAVKNLLKRDDFKLISCHIGNGVSICAIKDMKCLDTSMGFTPLGGVMMGTRSGDIDPSIIPFVMEREGKNALEVIEDLNKKSGLLGLSEFSNDMRDVFTKSNEGDEMAIIAKNKFIRRIVDYIAQYYVLLDGVDLITFSAGMGENNIPIRREICEKLSCLGIKIDLDLNNTCGETVKISTDDSKIDVYVIPTNEELVIARDTKKFVNR